MCAAPPQVRAQSTAVERAGDVLMVSMPIASLTSALMAGDEGGAGRFLLGFATNGGVTEGLKLLVEKERPDGSDNESFPSGHTSIAFQSATFVHLRYGLSYGAPAYAAAAFVGYSRVRARKHFVEDVAVGAVIGVLSAGAFTHRRPRVGGPSGSDLALAGRVSFGSGAGARWRLGLVALPR